MYLKSRVKIPDVHGKLTRLRRGDITYIKYEYDRYYDPEKKYTYPQRATIGKVCADDDTMMIPNEAFLKYFPDAVLSGMEDRTERSSCLRVGTYAAIHKIVSDYSLDKLLGQFGCDKASIGFSLIIDRLMAAINRQNIEIEVEYSGVLLVYSEDKLQDAVKRANELRKDGINVCMIRKNNNKSESQYIEYAKASQLSDVVYI